ncbi:hypothetical protein M404DRAFT_993762 [Pisolithus tinctorius Marx 270]|uniref:Uncharacterized protein n=1 Tax=Pisolithus tinctorius Marx 270 TaxID=870435 RepID=A0A0C3JUG7_PISTI|nr:hypothetical protein M404DRAFT_993762 [Pisolithus tinctorius Marx 270]
MQKHSFKNLRRQGTYSWNVERYHLPAGGVVHTVFIGSDIPTFGSLPLNDHV